MKRWWKVLIFIPQILIFILYLYFDIKIPCLFKSIFSIACPTCGMTRAMLSLLHGDIMSAIYYNILAIPLVILLIVIDVVIIVDLVKNSNYLEKIWKVLVKHYKVIILLFIVSMIINNIKLV